MRNDDKDKNYQEHILEFLDQLSVQKSHVDGGASFGFCIHEDPMPALQDHRLMVRMAHSPLA
jgi:hypothetical protein